MKRKSWDKKITAEGRALLELRRKVQELQRAEGLFPAEGVDPAKWTQAAELSARVWAVEQEHYRQFPKTKVIELQPEFVALFPMMKSLKAGPHRLSQGLAESFEAAQAMAMFFEKEPQLRGFAYLMVTSVVGRGLKDFLKMAKRRIPLRSDQSPEKAIAWLGKSLEMMGRMLQGKNPRKGKMDFELIDLIRFIREHETEKLTWSEVREALAFAGRHVTDAEGLRLFALRARKKGLL